MVEYIGFNSIRNLQKILKENNFKKIFLITGKKSFECTNIKETIFKLLKNFTFFQFNDFTPNPEITEIKKGLELINKDKYDVIVAVGGGSVIDMGKSISILSTNKEHPEQLVLNKVKIRKKGVPLIRIPTTAGSGSEETHFAVVYIGKAKYSLADVKYMKPDYVIVDPQFTYSLPKHISAYSGMDAFTQAVESFWNIHSTKDSKSYSKKAIKLILNNILKVIEKPNIKTRFNMSIAANYAGKAINITKTTACHSISYPVTSYFNIPHGHAVALTLPSMIVFNSEVTENDNLDPRGVDYVKKTMRELLSILGASDFIEAKEKTSQLMQNIGLKIRLKDLGIASQDDIDLIIKNGFKPDRVKNNPRKLTEHQLRRILEDIQ